MTDKGTLKVARDSLNHKLSTKLGVPEEGTTFLRLCNESSPPCCELLEYWHECLLQDFSLSLNYDLHTFHAREFSEASSNMFAEPTRVSTYLTCQISPFTSVSAHTSLGLPKHFTKFIAYSN